MSANSSNLLANIFVQYFSAVYTYLHVGKTYNSLKQKEKFRRIVENENELDMTFVLLYNVNRHMYGTILPRQTPTYQKNTKLLKTTIELKIDMKLQNISNLIRGNHNYLLQLFIYLRC